MLYRGELCKQVTGFRIVAAVDVTIGVEKRIASLVLLGTETCLHFETGYEVNGTKLCDINKKFAAAEIQFQDRYWSFVNLFFLNSDGLKQQTAFIMAKQPSRVLVLTHIYILIMLLIMTCNLL